MGETIELAKFQTKKIIRFDGIHYKKLRDANVVSLSINISEDRNKLVFYYNSENQEDPENISINTVLVDANQKETIRSTMKIPLQNLTIWDIGITNSGVLKAFGWDLIKEDDGNLKRNDYTKNKPYLFTFDPIENFYNQMELNIENTVLNAGLKIFQDESVLIYGLYNNEDNNERFGAFFLKITDELNIDFLTLDNFGNDFFAKPITEKQKEKAKKFTDKKLLNEYLIHDLIVKENGDYVILAEHGKLAKIMTEPGVYTNEYIYGNIIIAGCSSTGEFTFKQIIPDYDRNIGGSTNYSHFWTMVQGNSIILIYNVEKEKNSDEKQSLSEKYISEYSLEPAIVNIPENGEISIKQLIQPNNEEFKLLSPMECARISNTELILYFYAFKRGIIFGKLELN